MSREYAPEGGSAPLIGEWVTDGRFRLLRLSATGREFSFNQSIVLNEDEIVWLRGMLDQVGHQTGLDL